MKHEEIIQLAKQEGLLFTEERLKINESGVDFQVAHATDLNGEKWILRIPRQKESMRHAAVEKHALDILNENVSFQVPRWSVFTEHLIAYKQLDGVPAATIDMEQQAYVWELDEQNPPDVFYRSMGKAMVELHTLKVDLLKNAGITIIEGKDMRTAMKKRMNHIKEHFDIHPALWERWENWLANEQIWPAHAGVRHGDLHPGHILINEQSAVTGFIDWTEVSVGDVSFDFTAHLQIFGKEGLRKLIDSYEAAGGRTWPGMAEHIEEVQAAGPIVVAEYALVSGLEEMHEMAVQMLGAEE
ncbi:macrolide 2'-phosphotransferase [Jeotgalibacillus haloalkalitolerans]|uniref:Macrolide 2'-phosphotransferase n=1 Tax=Jeotgalibacillus haloalkalitolerans TaxID=3104292 RepID=A0ABU5KPX9_9BACL|nr:macrolide 2'-phosphotransferase [Jeotgalibacillus sp. HH7-29]MDZ5712755.1 macrolide 2'-phosphotransferase [Jeotgalibacillus sp. HH7-29]